MDNLQSNYMEENEEEDEQSKTTTVTAVATTELVDPTTIKEPANDDEPNMEAINPAAINLHNGNKTETEASEDLFGLMSKFRAMVGTTPNAVHIASYLSSGIQGSLAIKTKELQDSGSFYYLGHEWEVGAHIHVVGS